MKTDHFKTCTTCSKPWETIRDFLADPELALAGYQVAFEDLEGGLFLFNHLHENCSTTLAITVTKFTVLSSRPILARSGKRPSGCSGFCAHSDDLSPCPVACECGWVREIMQIIRNWQKQAA